MHKNFGAEPPGFYIFGHEKSKNVPTSKKKGISVFLKFIPSKKNIFVKIGQLGQKQGSFKYTPTLILYHQKCGAEAPRSNKTPITQKVTGIIWEFWHGWKAGDRGVKMSPWYPTTTHRTQTMNFWNGRKSSKISLSEKHDFSPNFLLHVCAS